MTGHDQRDPYANGRVKVRSLFFTGLLGDGKPLAVH